MITQQMMSDEISQAYGDRPPEEQAAAQTAYNLGLQWVNSQPVTWCSPESKSKKEARREERRKRKEQAAAMYDSIYKQMVPSETKTVEGVQVVGIGFIAMWILGAIISWVVQKILSHYWDEYWKNHPENA